MTTKENNTAPARPWIAEMGDDGFFDVVSSDGIVLAQKCVKEEARLFADTPELLEVCEAIRNDCEAWLDDEMDIPASELLAALKVAAETAIARAKDEAA